MLILIISFLTACGEETARLPGVDNPNPGYTCAWFYSEFGDFPQNSFIELEQADSFCNHIGWDTALLINKDTADSFITSIKCCNTID